MCILWVPVCTHIHKATVGPPTGVSYRRKEGRKERIVLFNDTLNTFYIWLYGEGLLKS